MTQYTPTTDEIRELLTDDREWASTTTVPSGRLLAPEEFDRWFFFEIDKAERRGFQEGYEYGADDFR